MTGNGKLNGMGAVTGFPVRAERLTLGAVGVIAALGAAFAFGSQWAHIRDEAEAQQDQIDKNQTVIEQVGDALNAINANLEAMRALLARTTSDRWRGEDMREWGSAAAKTNEGFSAPEIESLPGYAKRNEADGRLAK